MIVTKLFLAINPHGSVLIWHLVLLLFTFISSYSASNDIHYNIADPECNGPFGFCTQEDKDKLGYLAIKKLHAKMDEDSDGQVEVQETKEFMKEELHYKNGAAYSERQKKFHAHDLLISVDEMWKSWKYSPVYNWTTDNLIVWLNDQVKLPQYADNFRRNRIDGQFLPRFAINENNYYSNVMQIKDARHRRLLMIKSTDLILFGQQHKPHNLIKDVLMIGALTMSIVVCIYLYTKHRQSLDHIKKLLVEFEKLSDIEDGTVVNQIKNNLNNNKASLFSFNLRKNSVDQDQNLTNGFSNGQILSNRRSEQKESLLMTEKNAKLTKELNIVKQEADHLRKARENADGQMVQLKLAEQELEKVRNALKQTEARLELIKFQPPVNLMNLLNRTFDSEKELLDYKFKLIDKEKEACVDSLKKVCKRQSGLLGALKIAHSSTLEDIQHKLEILTHELKKLNAEKHELHKRWNNIFDMCSRTENYTTGGLSTLSSFDNGSQDLPESEDLNNKDLVQSNETNESVQKPLIQSASFETVSSFLISPNSSSKSKLVQNKHSVDGLHEFDVAEKQTMVNNGINSKIDDTNNNKIGLVNLNENGLTIVQQPTLKSPSFVIKSIQNPNHETIITNIISSPKSKKIARDTLIHKNDVFQFDDVESVKTSDMFFKSTPQSSFESDDTYKSSLNQSTKLSRKNKGITSSFRKKNGLFASSKMKKSSTSSKIEGDLCADDINDQPKVKLERSNTFTRHLSSLRRIFISKQNSTKSISHTNLDTQPANQINEASNDVKSSAQSIPVVITPNTNKKQLTISVNSSNGILKGSANGSEKMITNGNHDNISIPPSNSNMSFTIKSCSNDNVSEANSFQNESDKKLEKKSKVFNFKFGKNKKNKTKN